MRAALLASSAMAVAYASPAWAQSKDFDLPAQPASSGIAAFAEQADVQILVMESDTRGKKTSAVRGSMTPAAGLQQLLAETGLRIIAGDGRTFTVSAQDPQGGSAAGGGAEVEGLIVTAQKREENIQDVPIAMSAFSQETLTERQVAGGPDLITQIPNMSFTKTNFSSYSIQIRGIGTQAISATTDPAVAVAFNNTPFIRNRFFEQEFYDLQRLEVLRGPQGTLYGRNATAGVVNLISAKPTFRYEAKLSGDLGNYNSSRLEGMINIPLVEDKVALRLAGAWTKRDGYAVNQMTGSPIDGRDLWSTRLSLRFEPSDRLSANFIYEHFQEDDDRLRSGKQLCKKDPAPATVNGIPITPGGGLLQDEMYLSQGCLRESLYSPNAFQTPNGYSLPYGVVTSNIGAQFVGGGLQAADFYASATQSRNLRVIESSVEPDYRAKVDIAELQIAFDLSDSLTLNSETAYGADFLWSVQDFNRFTTTPGVFQPSDYFSSKPGLVDANGVFCDPQIGCSDRLMLVDLSTEASTQFSQEFRLGSDFDGPFNFSLGANYLRHDAEVKYYVFINTLTNAAGSTEYHSAPYQAGVTDNSLCQGQGGRGATAGKLMPNAAMVGDLAPYYDPGFIYGIPLAHCIYIDPNPIGALNDQGRNYFLSKNPYKLISYAAFGEAYYNITPDLKLTAGLRFTVDRKTAPQVPSWLLASWSAGEYPTAKTVFQEWREPTGRLAIDWKPGLGFTDDTLVYASYARGYKAGGANPPPPVLVVYGGDASVVNEFVPDTFEAEYIDAFEIGTKNTLLDGALTLNLGAFYYDYKNYQVSEIRNRTAVNANYDAEVWGAEIEADWRITEALRLGFKGGYNGTRIADGERAIDLIDRTAGQDGWILVKSFPTVPSNCIIPADVATAEGTVQLGGLGAQYNRCIQAYTMGNDPITRQPYDPSITNYALATRLNDQGVSTLLGPAFANYHGFDPLTAPNGGAGFDKELGGNELPNAPNWTATITADYTASLPNDWLLNLHADLHWQSASWWRVFQDHEYGRLDEYLTMNLAAIFRNEEAGWNVMAYVKNVTDETAITGAFLNSDDTGLTTNVFLTEPRLYGVRVTKEFTGGSLLGSFGERHEGLYRLAVEIGGGVGRYSSETSVYDPDWFDIYDPTFPISVPLSFHDQDLDWGDTRSVKLTYVPADGWRASAAWRFGKTNGRTKGAAYEPTPGGVFINDVPQQNKYERTYLPALDKHWRGGVQDTEEFEVVDFMVGKEVGIGAWGEGGASMLGVGLRRASFRSTSNVMLDGIPDVYSPPEFSNTKPGLPPRTVQSFTSSLDSEREFEGMGPQVAWDASVRLLGDEDGGHADLDWSVSGGVLFGEQTVESEEARYGREHRSNFASFAVIPTTVFYDDAIPRSRTEDVTVPNLSLSLGLSYSIDRVKVSTGYSYDRFFDVIDGGYRESETFDRTIQGPYLKLSLGFGG